MGAGQPADHRTALGGDLRLWLGQDSRGRVLLADNPAAAGLGLGLLVGTGSAFLGAEVAVRAHAPATAPIQSAARR